jgi:hypothetical protein
VRVVELEHVFVADIGDDYGVSVGIAGDSDGGGCHKRGTVLRDRYRGTSPLFNTSYLTDNRYHLQIVLSQASV